MINLPYDQQTIVQLKETLNELRRTNGDREEISLVYHFMAKTMHRVGGQANKKALVYSSQSLKLAKARKPKYRNKLFKKIAISCAIQGCLDKRVFSRGVKASLGWKYVFYKKSKIYKLVKNAEANQGKLASDLENMINPILPLGKGRILVLVDNQVPISTILATSSFLGNADFFSDAGAKMPSFREESKCNTVSLKDVIPLSSALDIEIAKKAATIVSSKIKNYSELMGVKDNYYASEALFCCSYEFEDAAYGLLKIYHSIKALLSKNIYSSVLILSAEGSVTKQGRDVLKSLGSVPYATIDAISQPKLVDDTYFLSIIKKRKINSYLKLARSYNLKASSRYKGDTDDIMPNLMGKISFGFDFGSALLIVTTSTYPLYFSNIIPVIKKLTSDSNVLLVLSGKATDSQKMVLKSINNGRLTFIETHELNISNNFNLTQQYFFNKWLFHLEASNVNKLFFDESIDFSCKTARVDWLFIRDFSIYLAVQRLFLDLIEHFNVQAFVASPDRMAIARIGAKVFKDNNVPSVFVQGCFQSSHPRYKKPVCDHIVVMDSLSEELFKQTFNLPDHLVHRLGAPRMDVMVPESTFHNKGDVQLEFIDNNETILLATQHFSLEYNLLHIRALCKAILVAQKNSVKLLIKIHPAEPATNDFYYNRECMSLLPSTSFEVLRGGDLSTLLEGSKLTVTGFSNVGLEAAIKRKPVMLINLTGEKYPFPIERMGFAPMLTSEQQVINFVSRFFDTEVTKSQCLASIDAFLESHPFLIYGDSAQRVASFIKGLKFENVVTVTEESM